MASFKVLLILTVIATIKCEDDLQDFNFDDPEEVMVAQESRQYQTIVKPPIRIIKPTGVTNSHRPQYNLDSFEDDRVNEQLGELFAPKKPDFNSVHKMRSRETLIKDAVLRALERKDHVGKFAQILPIIRAMSGHQRVALASLVASQVTTPPGRAPLNLAQVRSMFGNNDNTSSDLMLPILLDTANLIRRAVRSGKEPREVREPLLLPQPQLLRRSSNDAVKESLEVRETHNILPQPQQLRRTSNEAGKESREVRETQHILPQTQLLRRSSEAGKESREVRETHNILPQPQQLRRTSNEAGKESREVRETQHILPQTQLLRRSSEAGKESHEVRETHNILLKPQLQRRSFLDTAKRLEEVKDTHNNILPQPQLLRRSDTFLDDEPFDTGSNGNVGENNTITTTTQAPKTRRTLRPRITYKKTQESVNETLNTTTVTNDTTDSKGDDKNVTKTTTTSTEPPNSTKKSISKMPDNSSLDLAADSTNTTLAQDLPVAEKLRAFNRFIDRKGNLIRRGTYPPKPPPALRRTTAEPSNPVISRRRPPPARKLTPVADQGNCELFTNTLCLHSEDYPTDAIVQSIRRNKAAAGALLADFKDPGEGALDGVTAAQEAQYTADHYLTSNRRGDTASRDFASAGEAGFMCPSTVKYARPQRARATSGQWKYIVNTGEHTQTLRLEKCLKPKESCTYLTDNFKSKCVQVYNYHRLLTWDQQNGLHMDIFKVPTCCSCHIEGYSVNFPPLGHRIHETSSENFPGEDLSAEHGNGALEQVQSTVHRPSKLPPFSHKNKPLESLLQFSDNHNLLTGSPFMHQKLNENDEINSHLPASNPMDSYGNTYIPDSFNQATSIRNVKRPSLGRNPTGAATNNFDSEGLSATLSSYLEPPTPSAISFSFAKDTKLKMGNTFKRPTNRNRNRPIRKKIGGPDDLNSSGTSAVVNLEILEDFNDDLEEAEGTKTNVNVSPDKRGIIAPKLPAVTTEKVSTTRSQEHKKFKETVAANGKRINYNYHPIIDFFGDGEKDGAEENKSIDREDMIPTFMPSTESEWKPINHLPSRSIQTSNVRTKHK